MANLDSREKRASGTHVGLPWRGLLPLPDGTVSQADRQQTAAFYAGVAAITATNYLWWLRRRRRMMRNLMLVILVLGLLAISLPGWAEEKTPLDEMDALKIERLVLERKVLEERTQKLQQEARAIQAEAQIAQADYAAKARDLDALIDAAAKRAGVDPKVYRPDIGSKTWRPAREQ